MWRWLVFAGVLYAGGHPALDAYRPAAFERSLREFHRDVNRTFADTMQTVTGIDHARALQQFVSLSAQLQAMLPRH